MASVIFLRSKQENSKYSHYNNIRWGSSKSEDVSYIRPIIAKGNIIEGIEAKE